MDIDLDDEDVRIAVRALGQMRSSATVNASTSASNHSTSHTPALSLSMASTHPASSPPHTPPLVDEPHTRARLREEEEGGEGSPMDAAAAEKDRYPSLARMQSLPLVSGALRVYDTAKTNSRVVQYTSSLVTSSLRHGTSLLPAGSGERMDEFAGGMLDRLDKYRRLPTPSSAPPPPPPLVTPAAASSARGKRKKTLDGSPSPSAPSVDDEYEARRYDEEYDGRRYEHDRKRRWREGEDGEYEREDERERERDREEGRGKAKVPGWLEATSPFVPAPGPPPPLSKPRDPGARDPHAHNARGASRRDDKDRERNGNGNDRERSTDREGDRDGEGGQVAVSQRSRWQAVLLEAGGLSAALSDESMRRLRYCLSWLQYATQHIDAQILILRDFIASLHPHPIPPPGSTSGLAISTQRDADDHDPARPPPPAPELTPDHLRTLSHLRSDIVHTIRQVVGVVSKYAGGALPEPARGRVRGFILDLPRRFGEGGGAATSPGGWSGGGGVTSPGGTASSSATGVAAGSGGAGAGATRRSGAARSQRGTGGSAGVAEATSPTGTGSAPGSPHTHLRSLHGRRGSVPSTGVEPGKALAAAQRVLVLATESLDMMRGVTAVVADSLDRADAWVDRLRTVGIQRGMDGLALPDGNGEWAGATPAWPGPPRSPGYASTSGSGARSPAYVGSGSHSHGYASPTYASGSGSGAPSPAFGIGGISLGSSRYSTPAPGEEERAERDGRERDTRERERERDVKRERDEGDRRMEVDG
ncbi:hypothetical protein MSAN_00759200 [Mycena sanguinolenta]|uniref:Opi1-domain-containing protein n=1 Tax=Mycena sanguinolenta TaxID=230812 RepID=A0A8H6Z258_9AGAR|nr:hypothetical protein MSAN_00759200 [Mycena sanguinolenta]